MNRRGTIVSKIDFKIRKFNKTEIPVVAKLLESAWEAKANPITSDRWINWLEKLDCDFPPFSISAIIKNKLVGWILLFKHSPTEVEINPWALGGHPITLLEYDSSFEISKLLLDEATSFTKKEGFRKVEILFHIDEKTIGDYEKLYQEKKFTLLDSTNHMRKLIPELNEETDTFSNNFEIKTVSTTDQEDLISCYIDTFIESNDPWLKEKTKDELREYFKNDLIGGPFNLIDEASLSISKEGKIIGFSFVKQSHGENNGNILLIGVHPDFRRKKIGTGIFTHITESLRNSGYKTMSLNVSSFNVPAYQLYLKLGFEKSWTQLNYVWKT